MEIEKLTKDNLETVIASGVVLIDFWATWCGPCKIQGAILDKLALPPEMEGKVRVGKVNIDEEPTLAAKYRVQSIPTLLIIKGGEVVQTYVGVQRVETLIDKLTQIVNG